MLLNKACKKILGNQKCEKVLVKSCGTDILIRSMLIISTTVNNEPLVTDTLMDQYFNGFSRTLRVPDRLEL